MADDAVVATDESGIDATGCDAAAGVIDADDAAAVRANGAKHRRQQRR